MGRKIAAIILSAGLSSRMGEFKPLLTFGGTPALERIILLFQESGITDVRVVLGHRSDELLPLVRRLGAQAVINERFREGMFSSVLAGVRTLDKELEAFFLLPVDIPLVRHRTIGALIHACQGENHGLFYPVYHGKRGHPPLISVRYRAEILSWGGEAGLKGILSRHEDEAIDVETGDEAILRDMDTLANFEQLRGLWLKEYSLLPQECENLLAREFALERPLLDHCRNVANLVVFLATKLNESGCHLDVACLEAAALLHDLAKGLPDHAAKGAEILSEKGFVDLARLVAVHMDIRVTEGEMILPAEILYLADKMVSKNRCVTLDERFSQRLKSSALNPDMREAVQRRLQNALIIMGKIETKLGCPLYEILRENGFM